MVTVIAGARCRPATVRRIVGAASHPRCTPTRPTIDEALRDGGACASTIRLRCSAYVLTSLPERVQVYPTENYFYFRFVHNGAVYRRQHPARRRRPRPGQGEFRLQRTADRLECRAEEPSRRCSARSRASRWRRPAPLTYRVAHAGKTVIFALNDLSQVKPPPGMLRAGREIPRAGLRRVGIRFFLVFNSRLKVFHYRARRDRAGRRPVRRRSRAVEPILIGKRTGFAFYPFDGRKILVGVNERQSRLNTYFDGPFDQLPENFIEGEALREAILAADPERQRQDRPARQFCRRLGPLSDPSLSALPAAGRSCGVSPLRHVKSGGRRPIARPAS